METAFSAKPWRWLRPELLLLAVATCCATAATPKRVFILDSFGRDVAPFSAVASSFRTTLARELGETVDVNEASLEADRFADQEMEAPFAEFLEHRFAGHRLDLVVPIGAPAAGFVDRYRARLFAQTPILFTTGDPRLVRPDFLATNATHVTQSVNLPGMVEDILRMQPETTNIVVVFGVSPLEKFWASECRREFDAFTNRVGFTWGTDLPLDQLLQRCAALPPRSFILFGMLVKDAAGVPYDNDTALNALHAVAKAPIYSYFSSQFGLGIVGGSLYQDTSVGTQAARVAIRILRGEKPATIPPLMIEPPFPVYDWRELHRWGISEARLPADSRVLFRQASFWELYRQRVIAVIALCIGEGALIALLVASLVKRRRAERSLRDLSGRLINAQEDERARLARELHDDITQRLARLAIDVGRLEQGTCELPPAETAGEVREGLVRLSDDVHALSYRLHPSVLEDLGLAEALRAEGERFTRRESIPVELKLRAIPESVPHNAGLCLFRVAQEALRNVARHAQARTVEVSLRGLDGGLQLAIRDDGRGFDPAVQRGHHSLGLASMRERVHLLGGELDIESARGEGATVVAWVPLKREQALGKPES